MVAPCLASPATPSRSGTAVLDWALVSMMVCVTPGSVSCVPSAQAAARNAVTPGTTTHLTPAPSSASICSLMAPYIVGSPSCSRTTVPPPAAPSLSASVISSRTIPEASCMAAPPRHMPSMAGGMSEPEYTTTEASPTRSRALTVIRPGSPGPHPTK